MWDGGEVAGSSDNIGRDPGMLYSGDGSVSPTDARNEMMELWVGDYAAVS